MPLVAATPETIAAAAVALRAGRLVAFPSETVYGLGADAGNGQAVAQIYAAKGRPSFNPLIVHVADVAAAERIAVLDEAARRLAAAFWPGPLTLVLPRRADAAISDLVTAGLDTIALRVPAHPTAQALLAGSGLAIAAPSANRSGHVSATRAEHVQADLGDAPAFILDAGPCTHGLESTIVDVTGTPPRLLRAGAIAATDIERVLGEPLMRATEATTTPQAPGQLASHYAPSAPLRLEATSAAAGEALLAFGPHPLPHTGAAINLSPTADLVEAAANLFTALRRLDLARPAAIAVMPIPADGLGEAINDRLRRAAAPRD